MPVRIRLQRHGKKGRPFYQIVVADGRAPRDGKFIENLGTYNPMTNPATVTIDTDRAVSWLRNGAQPSDTVRSLMSHKGVMLKHHLLRGVDKKAMTLEQAEAKYAAWMEAKEAKTQKTISDMNESDRNAFKKRMEAEAKVNETKANAVAAKKAALEAAAAPVEEAPVEEAPVAEPSNEAVEVDAATEATETSETSEATEEPKAE